MPLMPEGSDAKVFADPILRAFGVPGTITRPAPDDVPIETTVVWVPPDTLSEPDRSNITRRRPHRILGVPLADVPTVPSQTVIAAPLVKGGDVLNWVVDGFDRIEFDITRVVVIPGSA